MKIYTETTTLEEWTLDKDQTKAFCEYIRSEESWDAEDYKDKSDLEILEMIDLNADKYNDEMRSWLYDNVYEPYKEWAEEQGAYLFFKEKDFTNGNI